MRLQTKVEIPDPNFSIDYNSSICLFGSCFASNFGKLFSRLKFSSLVNPYGVLYNPASIAQGIKLLFEKERFLPENLNFYNEKWLSFFHHSDFSSPDKETCLKNINDQLIAAKEKLNNANIVFITLGTSWIYRYNKTSQIVANCHKIPSREFNREFLQPADSSRLLVESVKQLKSVNPDIKIVFTISPIRHFKDGAIENMRSKSSLILAISQLQKDFPECYYFPVYEIFMDELRDYRFYTSDMLHPSETAISYIWEIFSNTFFSPETLQQINQVEKLVKSYEHRPTNRKTENFKSFANNLLAKTETIEKQIPNIDFSIEKKNIIDYI